MNQPAKAKIMVLLLLGILIITAVLVAIWLYSRKGRNNKKTLLLFAAVSLTAIGAILSITTAVNLYTELEIDNWPMVTGRVASVEIGGTRAFHPVIGYRYTVAGREFEATRHLETPGFGGKRKRLDVAEKTTALYRPGMEIAVYYNPENPAESRLQVGPEYGTYLQLALGLMLLVAGIAVPVIFSPAKPASR